MSFPTPCRDTRTPTVLSIAAGLLCSALAASAQTNSPDPGNQSANTVVEHSNDGRATTWRAVRTRTASGGREVVVETVEARDANGRMSKVQEIVTETNRSAPASVETRRDVFGFGADGRRRLLTTTESQEQTLSNRDTNAVRSTFEPDLNGRAAVTSRTIENTRAMTPAVRQTVTTTLSPDPNASLRETTRVERTERTDAAAIRYESTHMVRDVNGRWVTTERRTGDTRASGASARAAEQTTERLNVNGHAAVVERTLSSASSASEPDDVVLETHVPYVDPLPGSAGGLALSEQTHRTTTRTADGGRSTVEEVTGRNPAAPGDPMRVIRRTVTTVRANGANRWITEQETFERDVNGRMVRVSTEREERSGEK